MNNNFKNFLERHNIRMLNEDNYCEMRYPTYNYFSEPSDYNIINSSILTETHKLYTIQIPQRELERLQEFEDEVFNNIRETGHYNLFQNLMEQKEQESRLRKQYPTVDIAYKKYSLMLNLASTGKINI